MKKQLNNSLLLLVIVGIALVLRVYKINAIPPSLSWDEVSIGYNAYSILKTGRDEHQRLLPIDTFAAFGDYKPPVPIYLTVPFVAVFGLNELAVRLPSALFGTATVLLTFFLVQELLSDKKQKQAVAMVSALILSFSPWHINLSRAGFEANIALFFVVLGVTALLKARNNQKIFWVSWIPFVVAIYTFNSARYFVPLLSVVLIWFLRKPVIQHKRSALGGIFIAVLLMLPILPHLLSPAARLRFTEVNIFSDASVVVQANERIAVAGNTWWANILTNRRVGFAISYAKHFFDHFDPAFLFIRGDGNPKFSIQDVGQFYVIELPFMLIGLYALFVEAPKVGILLVLWLLLALVPAATARETPHALRILNSLPTWHIFIAYGLVFCYRSLKSHLKTLIFGLTALLLVGNILFYLHNYYRHYPYEYSGEWQYGYREAFQYAQNVTSQYKKIVVSEIIGRAYAYALFYGMYPPEDFWNTKDDLFDAAGFYHVYGFGQYRFADQTVEVFESETLYILPPDHVPAHAVVKKTFTRLNGTTTLVAFEI